MDVLNMQTALPAARENPSEWDGKDVADLLGLTRISESRFQTRCAETNEHGRIYGGQILGQALYAALQSVLRDRFASCVQLLFAAGGLPDQTIDFEVAALQDGNRFSARHVRGVQGGGRIVCDASVAFAKAMESPDQGAPTLADCGLDRDPDGCARLEDVDAPGAREVERTLPHMSRPHRAIDMRAPFVDDLMRSRGREEPRMRFWIRLRQKLAESPALHAAAFAYLSDYWINFAACIAHVRATWERGHPLRGKPQSHDLVSSGAARRRMGALRLRKPQRGFRARTDHSARLFPRRRSCRQRDPRMPSVSERLTKSL
jgi:acyl-CoA thioesterase II